MYWGSIDYFNDSNILVTTKHICNIVVTFVTRILESNFLDSHVREDQDNKWNRI